MISVQRPCKILNIPHNNLHCLKNYGRRWQLTINESVYFRYAAYEYSSRDSLEKGIPGPIPKIDLPAANVESTLSVGAVKALKEIRQAVEQRAPGKPKATVTRLPTRTGISAQSLRAGASLVRHGLAVSPASVKPGPDPIPPGPM